MVALIEKGTHFSLPFPSRRSANSFKLGSKIVVQTLAYVLFLTLGVSELQIMVLFPLVHHTALLA
jgi:hypothetical protein